MAEVKVTLKVTAKVSSSHVRPVAIFVILSDGYTLKTLNSFQTLVDVTAEANNWRYDRKLKLLFFFQSLNVTEYPNHYRCD